MLLQQPSLEIDDTIYCDGRDRIAGERTLSERSGRLLDCEEQRDKPRRDQTRGLQRAVGQRQLAKVRLPENVTSSMSVPVGLLELASYLIEYVYNARRTK